MTTAADLSLTNHEPPAGDLLNEVVAGLTRSPRTLPCKLLYDRRGSELFDRICEQPEYYPTRTEMAIMRRHANAMCAKFGPRCLLIELGSGSSLKTAVLLDGLRRPAGYVPVDISREHLLASARRLASDYPRLPIMPVCADYNQPFEIPRPPIPPAPPDAPAKSDEAPTPVPRREVIYFPGSTIGNFHPADAQQFMRNMADLVENRQAKAAGHASSPPGRRTFNDPTSRDQAPHEPAREGRDPDGSGASGEAPRPPEPAGLLIGVDLVKSAATLRSAYNDVQGVTAAFNLNLLTRINREADADFNLDAFTHQARWNEAQGRMEMHLVSRADQTVVLDDRRFHFQEGESILTECSYKYTVEGFAALAGRAGWSLDTVWTDEQKLFSVQYLTLDA